MGLVDGIGKALAGAGQAAATLGFDEFRNQAMAARDEALHQKAMVRQKDDQTFRTGERLGGEVAQVNLEQNVKQPFQRTEREAGQTFTAGERALDRTHAETILDAQQSFLAEQNDLQRTLTREQIRSHERVAAGNNATALRVAQTGGVVQQDTSGNMLFVDKTGKPTQIMDPNKPGEPLKGYKDLTPAAKQYAEVIKAQLVGLDREEIAALDPTSKSAITQRRADLNEKLLNVLTGGITAATIGKAPYADGTEVRGRDGRIYVVTNGQPVPRAAGAGGLGLLSSKAAADEGTPPPRAGGTAPAPGGAASGSTVMPELGMPAPREAPKARSQQAREQYAAGRDEREKARVADTFRSIVQLGKFVPDDRWIIEAALESGQLNDRESGVAKGMLNQLSR